MSFEERIFREFLETYNRITAECFERCVYSLNYRYLLDDEIDCVSNCTARSANFNQRISMNFAKNQASKVAETVSQLESQDSTNSTTTAANSSNQTGSS